MARYFAKGEIPARQGRKVLARWKRWRELSADRFWQIVTNLKETGSYSRPGRGRWVVRWTTPDGQVHICELKMEKGKAQEVSSMAKSRRQRAVFARAMTLYKRGKARTWQSALKMAAKQVKVPPKGKSKRKRRKRGRRRRKR